MSVILQLLINGVIAGAIYALVASGFSLIYSTTKFIHFAHGAVVASSAYFLYFLFEVLGFNFGFSIALSIVFASFLGFAMNFLVYKQLRVRETSPVVLLISSFSLLILFESLILILFGSQVKHVNFVKVAEGLSFFGAFITPLQLVIVAVSVAFLLGLFLFMKRSRLGKAMRAVSEDQVVAEVVGISSEKVYSWSFIIGSALAGVAAVLIGLEQNFEPIIGTNLIVKALAAAIIGGIGSVYGAVLGAFLLGILENVGIWYLPSGYKDAIAFVLLFVFLLFRPRGILGFKRRIK